MGVKTHVPNINTVTLENSIVNQTQEGLLWDSFLGSHSSNNPLLLLGPFTPLNPSLCSFPSTGYYPHNISFNGDTRGPRVRAAMETLCHTSTEPPYVLDT